jgi:hypothetical protein
MVQGVKLNVAAKGETRSWVCTEGEFCSIWKLSHLTQTDFHNSRFNLHHPSLKY